MPRAIKKRLLCSVCKYRLFMIVPPHSVLGHSVYWCKNCGTIQATSFATTPPKLVEAVKEHCAQIADDRCIEDDDKLYKVLGLKCDRRVGNSEEMLKNCENFIKNRCEGGHWPTYQQLHDLLLETMQELEEITTPKNLTDEKLIQLSQKIKETLKPGEPINGT